MTALEGRGPSLKIQLRKEGSLLIITRSYFQVKLYYLKDAGSVVLQDMELFVPSVKVASTGLRNKMSWSGSIKS